MNKLFAKRHIKAEQKPDQYGVKQGKAEQSKIREKPLIDQTVKWKDNHINWFVQSKPN